MGKDYCAIKDCHNTAGCVGRFNKKVKLHHLPKDSMLRRAWLMAISRKCYKSGHWTCVCSDHFPNGDGRTWKHTVPTLYLPQKANKDAKKRETRNSQKEGHALIHEGRTQSGGVESEHTKVPDSILTHNFHTYASSEEDYHVSTNGEQTLTTSQTCQTDPFSTEDQGISVCCPEICIEDLRTSEDILFYTGLPDLHTYNSLFQTLMDMGADKLSTEDPKEMNNNCLGRKRKLRRKDEFLLVMMRLRLGLLVKDLQYRFKISSSAISKIFQTWITFMFECMQGIVFLPELDVMKSNRIPKCFEDFSDTRVVLDCTELFIQTPSSLECKSVTYSNYKSHNTFKALIGVSMTGAVVIISKLYGGSASDVQITRECGLIELLNSGDAVMVDKGFIHIKEDLKAKGVKLYCPPFKTSEQFSQEEVFVTRKIACARIHVERKMEQIKNFRILQGVMPLALSKVADKIMFFVCAAMTNLLPPLVR